MLSSFKILKIMATNANFFACTKSALDSFLQTSQKEKVINKEAADSKRQRTLATFRDGELKRCVEQCLYRRVLWLKSAFVATKGQIDDRLHHRISNSLIGHTEKNTQAFEASESRHKYDKSQCQTRNSRRTKLNLHFAYGKRR